MSVDAVHREAVQCVATAWDQGRSWLLIHEPVPEVPIAELSRSAGKEEMSVTPAQVPAHIQGLPLK